MIKNEEKRNERILKIRIVLLLLILFSILGMLFYRITFQILSDNLAEYTMQLQQKMVESGVDIIENALAQGKEEANLLAAMISNGEEMQDAAPHFSDNFVRMIYMDEHGVISTDGYHENIAQQSDLKAAMQGSTEVYGPFLNENGEYLLRYSAPVLHDGNIIGVLCIEKAAISLSDLIANVNFVNEKETYLIDKQGTYIALSNPDDRNLVETQQNIDQMLKKYGQEEINSIVELHQKGLAGQTGIASYPFQGDLYYEAYAPIPSTGWVILCGMQGTELTGYIKAALNDFFPKESMVITCGILFVLLMLLVILWLVTSMRKSNRLNHELHRMANYDALTQVKNRNSFHQAIRDYDKAIPSSLVCIYIDANGLHEINNHMGHQAGDQMLIAIADQLIIQFTKDQVYRIGGDEFVVFLNEPNEENCLAKIKQLRERLKELHYEISVGYQYHKEDIDIDEMILCAETRMQQEKRQFYQGAGKERQLRILNKEVEEMALNKQYADTFLAVMAPEFKGVYFVDLRQDSVKHLYIPSYFEEILKEEHEIFSKSLSVYVQRYVKPEYYHSFHQILQYHKLEKLLNDGETPNFEYQKVDGTWIKLRILKFKAFSQENKQTLWIFSEQHE